MGSKGNFPRKGVEQTLDYKAFGKPDENKNIDKGFYDSDQYKNFSFTGRFGGLQTMDFNKSKYFGLSGSGSTARRLYSAMDRAYEDYLANRESGKGMAERKTLPNPMQNDTLRDAIARIPFNKQGAVAETTNGQPMTVGSAVAQGVERTPVIQAELRRRRKPMRRQTTGSLGTGGSL
jgi:hypothetical protein